MLERLSAAALALGLVAFAALATPSARAAGLGDSLGFSPYWDWRTIESEHFRLTFPAELEESARKAGGYLEEAHAVLSPKLHWQPWHKTQVVLVDNADLANGLTSPQLRLGLVLWVTPPDPAFSTAYYDDWLRLLAIHEYTHFLNMDNVQDFYVPLRYLFGDVLLPNSAWPTWMLEGLAVYMETRYTRAGRGRSPFYEMILRAAVADGTLDTPEFFTLDKFNGDVPLNPGGEAYYFFGYQLINQLARQPHTGRTADGMAELGRDAGPGGHESESALGMLSLRSAGRVPYFINGNLSNVVGKEWPDLWREWVTESRARVETQLSRIRSRPLTRVEPVSPHVGDNAIETLGPTPSPDGKWLAYTSDTPDRRSALYLLELATGQARRLEDKLSGTAMAFTPDSRAVVYSAVERTRLYYQFSVLQAHEIESGRTYRIAGAPARARDPDVSPDGKLIAFTETRDSTTSLAIAALEQDATTGRLRVGARIALPKTAGKYDRVATPRFSRDGKRVYFSAHRMGSPSEELLALEPPRGWADPASLMSDAAIKTLASDGKFNRYPAPARDGSVYFVSNRSGVDNLYRLPPGQTEPVLASNLATGLATPAIGPGGEIYASVYSSRGWSVARLQPLTEPVAAAEITVLPPPAPGGDSASVDRSTPLAGESRSYSLWPSILPRQWLPSLQLFPGGVYLQADVQGFDAIDRHSYTGVVGYNTQVPHPDWAAQYSNRSFGPTLTLYGARRTTSFDTDERGITGYTRRDEYSARLSYPVLWTYSSLVPSVGLSGERIYRHYRGYAPDSDDLVSSSPFVPAVDGALSFNDVVRSRLGISPEGGRTISAGARFYSDASIDQRILKGSLKAAQYLHLGGHVVLKPSIQAAWSSGFSTRYGDADASVEGRSPELFVDSPNSLFDSLQARGYPRTTRFSRSAAVGALDLRFPLWRIFRGWSTHPVFLDNLYGFGFAEATKFPSAPAVPWLGSVGGGLTLQTELLLHLPLEITLEYDQALTSRYGGKNDVYVAVRTGAISF